MRVRRPGDFVAVVPYLLGFHPAESLVVVLSRQGAVVLTARLDLPAAGCAGAVLDQLVGLSAQHHVDELVLLAYSDDDAAARQLLAALLAGVPDGVSVREALLVSRGRWWSLTCSGGCCPEDGTPFDPTDHPLAAEAVYAGLGVQPDRAAVAASVRGPDAADLATLRAELERSRSVAAALERPAAARLMAATVREELARPDPPDDPTATLLAALALDLTVRDVAWALMDRDAVQDHLRVWGAVVSRSPDEVASAPLGLLGMAAWISGDGALMNCCVERLERCDPGYTLGHLLAEISERALAPSLWEEMVADLRSEVGAVAGGVHLH